MSVRRELWTQARSLFNELVDLDSSQRKLRLNEIGESDPQLRATLESLLVADASDADPLRDYSFGPPLSAGRSASPRNDPLGIVGKTVSHFRVTGFVAAGGMGVVYSAQDLRLASGSQ